MNKKSDKKGNGKTLAAVAALAVILGGGALFGRGGFGTGTGGNGDNNINNGQQNTADTTVSKYDDDAAKSTENSIVIIKIEETDIYVNDVRCKDIGALKDEIGRLDAENHARKYEFVHETAIKATYDTVKKALYELEDALKIKINYND